MLRILFSYYHIFISIVLTQKFLLLVQYLKNWYIRKVKLGNAKNSSVFGIKWFLISLRLRLVGTK